ncbi:hypothetical protein RHSP_71778 [Rhizobium freirei PRF 81]|uniref:Transmembrane protein n=1 Tax=Rhizobium freirei PRF 81 TaxID=363754 RepID=N6TUH4_9HYPH|nr:hypothetical protein RHSP_71778 [Rhizobium freirei PRF 81]
MMPFACAAAAACLPPAAGVFACTAAVAALILGATTVPSSQPPPPPSTVSTDSPTIVMMSGEPLLFVGSSAAAAMSLSVRCLEHFCFKPSHRNALSLCFYAIPNAKPPCTFAGIALTIRCRRRSERRQQVDRLLASRRLLYFGQATASAVGDARLGDLVVGNGVLRGDILRPHDTGDVENADFLIHADFLRAADHQIAILENAGDDGGDEQIDLLRTLHLALAVGAGVGARGGRRIGFGLHAEDPGGNIPVHIAFVRTAAIGLVVPVRLVVDLDRDGQDVADIEGARVLEERRLRIVPERIALRDLVRPLRILRHLRRLRILQAAADRTHGRRPADFPEGLRLAAGEKDDNCAGGRKTHIHEGSFDFDVFGSDALAMILVMTAALCASISARMRLDWRDESFMMIAAAIVVLTSLRLAAAASGFIFL